jgi:sporulation protein YlmC with PRC-barrel domain
MKLRNLMLGGAACVMLSAPVFAQSIYTHEPTPEERVQTNNLNTQAAARARADADSSVLAQSDFNADRDRYERSLQDYRASRDAYDNDRANYEVQRAAFDRDRAWRWRHFAHFDRFNVVYRFDSDELIGLSVMSPYGERIGRIRDVDFTPSGRVNRVAIRMGYNRTVWIYADDIRYDPYSRMAMIDLSRDQIYRLSVSSAYGS